MSPSEEATEGRNVLKPRQSERGCRKLLEKPTKRWYHWLTRDIIAKPNIKIGSNILMWNIKARFFYVKWLLLVQKRQCALKENNGLAVLILLQRTVHPSKYVIKFPFANIFFLVFQKYLVRTVQVCVCIPASVVQNETEEKLLGILEVIRHCR